MKIVKYILDHFVFLALLAILWTFFLAFSGHARAADKCPSEVEKIGRDSPAIHTMDVGGSDPMLWRVTQSMQDGWYIFSNPRFSNNSLPNAYLVAVFGIRGSIYRGDVLIQKTPYLCFVTQKEIPDRNGFPILVKFYKAVYRKGTK